MLHGKHTCEQLKAIRQQIADANGIAYTPAQCTHDGPCCGTCPRCEAEKSYLEQQLSLKAKAGQAIKIIGIAASLVASAAAQPLSAQEVADTAVADSSLCWETDMFDFGMVRPEYEHMWAEMAEFIEAYPDRLYLMVGHTDGRGFWDYNLKLSQKRAEDMTANVLKNCKVENLKIICVGLACLDPHIPNAKDEAEHQQNRRASLETYNPNKYHGQAAALIELAIYNAKFPDKDHVLQIYKWEQQIEKLRTKTDSDKLTAEYDSLAHEIHSAWSK